MKITTTETKTITTEYEADTIDSEYEPTAVLYHDELFGVFPNKSHALRYVKGCPFRQEAYTIVPLTGDIKITF